MARGNGRMKIFVDDLDRRKFFILLNEMVDIFEVDCLDFCLMHTHYHLCVSNPKPNLSDAFHYLNGSYAFWWNARHRHVGHVFQGRFKDQVVQRDSYLTTLIRYIALNPVRAGLVRDPADWPWSGFRALAGLACAPPFLRTECVLPLFGEGLERQHENYIRHVCQPSVALDVESERFRSRERVVGDRSFKRSVLHPARTDLLPPDAESLKAVAAAV